MVQFQWRIKWQDKIQPQLNRTCSSSASCRRFVGKEVNKWFNFMNYCAKIKFIIIIIISSSSGSGSGSCSGSGSGSGSGSIVTIK